MFLPSSPGNFSYLCAANKGCRKSFYSAPHGTGRIYDRGKARSIFTNAQMEEEMRRRKVRVYDYGNGNKMEEHPASFKDVHSVIEILRKYALLPYMNKQKVLDGLVALLRADKHLKIKIFRDELILTPFKVSTS